MMRRLFLACALTAIVTSLVVGGVAWALQSPVDGSGAIHACYNPSTGAVKLNVTGACPVTGSNTPITWASQGLQGPQGVQGPVGDVGPQGPQGAAAPTPKQRLIPLNETNIQIPASGHFTFAPVDVSGCKSLSVYWRGTQVDNVSLTFVDPDTGDVIGSQEMQSEPPFNEAVGGFAYVPNNPAGFSPTPLTGVRFAENSPGGASVERAWLNCVPFS
jgi:hypothetical protein